MAQHKLPNYYIGPWLESGERCSHKLNLHADCLCVAKRNLQVNRCALSPEPQKIEVFFLGGVLTITLF